MNRAGKLLTYERDIQTTRHKITGNETELKTTLMDQLHTLRAENEELKTRLATEEVHSESHPVNDACLDTLLTRLLNELVIP